MRCRGPLPLFTLLVLLLAGACACAPERPAGNALAGAESPMQVTQPLAEVDSAAQGGLPSLTALPQAKPRRSSYLPSDLYKDGKQFDPAAGHLNVTPVGEKLSFVSAAPVPGTGLSGAALALYHFEIPGYGGGPLFSFEWSAAPPPGCTAYYCLANWLSGKWEFFPASGGSHLLVDTLGPYTRSGDSAVYVAVLQLGAGSSELGGIRLGSQAPQPQLSASLPFQQIAPVSAVLDASGSSDPDGTIVEYRWDADGDGLFETSTGTTSQLDHLYQLAAQYHPSVRVIDDSGIYADRKIDLDINDHMALSYGAPDRLDKANAGMVGVDGRLLLFGSAYNDSTGETRAAASNIMPDGSAAEQRQCDHFVDSEFVDAVLGSDGSVYACCKADNATMLLKLRQDLYVTWSEGLFKNATTVKIHSLSVVNGVVYVAGEMNGVDSLCAAVSCADGSVLWSRSMAGVQLFDVEARAGSQPGSAAVYCCGSSSIAGKPALFASYTTAGVRSDCQASALLGCHNIALLGSNPDVYVLTDGPAGAGGGKQVGLSLVGGGDYYYALDSADLQPAKLLANGSDSLLALISSPSGPLMLHVGADTNPIGMPQLYESVDGPTNGTGSAFLDGAGLLGICGWTCDTLPAPQAVGLTSSDPGHLWSVQSPTDSAAGLLSGELAFPLTVVSGQAFNREAADYDALLFLQAL